MLVKRQRRCKRHRRIFRRSCALAKKIHDLEEKEKKKSDELEAKKQQLKEEREKREAERNTQKEKQRLTKLIQLQSSKALAKICPCRVKLERVLTDSNISEVPSNIVKDAERTLKEVKALEACATKHVSGEPFLSKEAAIMDTVENLAKKAEAAYKVICDYQ